MVVTHHRASTWGCYLIFWRLRWRSGLMVEHRQRLDMAPGRGGCWEFLEIAKATAERV
ncbi:hypothetical protein F3Y22_tig00003725pilonHSYRG00181 [Hibiscus syriacus]|uniref:Uncharacterized protein n=1 Tax=Hibiscus syriacus TaxID=106335 RepID=A0A6A3CQ43_HIBSY|nr:hypothetical protein F3Y22_tig00003725pilonHSYRG00181 [Hibiscus syriacus]